jgi:hypothetical protein
MDGQVRNQSFRPKEMQVVIFYALAQVPMITLRDRFDMRDHQSYIPQKTANELTPLQGHILCLAFDLSGCAYGYIIWTAYQIPYQHHSDIKGYRLDSGEKRHYLERPVLLRIRVFVQAYGAWMVDFL